MPLMSLNDIRLYYEVEGSGFPIILLHPDTLDLSVWDDQVHALSRRYKVIRYDQRGHGRSDRPKTGYTLTDHVRDLEVLIRTLQIDNFYLIGLSGGASKAIPFALRFPHMIRALIFVDPFIFRGVGKNQLRMAEDARLRGIKIVLEEWFNQEGSVWQTLNPKARERAKDILLAHSGSPFLDPFFGSQRTSNDSQRLNEIYAPTLIIIGRGDTQPFQDTANLLARDIHGASKVVFDNSGHLPNMEEPEAFNLTVLKFLKRMEELRIGRLS